MKPGRKLTWIPPSQPTPSAHPRPIRGPDNLSIIDGRNEEDVIPIPPRPPNTRSPELGYVLRVLVAMGMHVASYGIFIPERGGKDLGNCIEIREAGWTDWHGDWTDRWFEGSDKLKGW